jgi:hypothetical protein
MCAVIAIATHTCSVTAVNVYLTIHTRKGKLKRLL